MAAATRIVVVGAGLAGLRTVEAVLDRDEGHDVTLIGDEPHAPYNRPPVSKQLLTGAMEPDECAFPAAALDSVRTLFGRAATGLDRGGRQVGLDDGTSVGYDRLVVATGRRARTWPDPPALSGFHLLRTLDDAVGLRAHLARRPRVVVVGAGFIGCEAAAALRSGGLEVDLVEMGPQPMPALGAEIGARTARVHADHGVRLHLGRTVAAFEGHDGAVSSVRLDDGTTIPADAVLLSLGSMPNTEWLSSSGLTLHRGAVLTDVHGISVDDPAVAAAGDCAAWPHPALDDAVSVEHWNNAAEMARAVVGNLLAEVDERAAFAPVPTFWSDQYDLKIKSAGFLASADRIEIVDEGPGPALVAEARRGDELVGVVTVNQNKRFLQYRRQLASRPVGASA
ncbi:NAD(P)/FAD-dependent oxidoreductase [Actinomycetospora sp. TBRC 11914]|uniref:NAD(P)/FAD-dependent oxidoreductase n=1 Tax=Actinomycetospora sp. TBRC 11914 TaxID=2729387 RepID=UPI00145D5F1F|nr:FAD-dependent oxidoreductase [Actinomycetospora sp. TBRC 11914]NMO91671.1 oxidoreductase [Actinomycetospora sp. TBRC 11914]